jgi:integrase
VAAKRARGTGSLIERLNADGTVSWVGQWRVDNKLVKRTVGLKRKPGARAGLTRTDASKALATLMADYEPPTAALVTATATVLHAGEGLIAEVTRLGRKRATIEDYESMLRVHLTPFFNGTMLSEVGRDMVKKFMDYMLKGGGSGKAKSHKTMSNAVKFLHAIFEYAQREQMSTGNPVRLVRRSNDDGTDSDIRYLSTEELEAVLRAVPNDYLGKVERRLYVVAAMTGLRQGELAGLRWRDVDWLASKVRVRQAFVREEFQKPKSRRGERAVPMPRRVATELEALSREGAYTADDDLVFCHPHTGRPIDRSKLSKRWRATAKRAGVCTDKRQVRFHDLRHTFGTRMAAAGVPMRTLQEWMGHRDFKTTLIYADYAPSERDVEWAEAAFGEDARHPSSVA